MALEHMLSFIELQARQRVGKYKGLQMMITLCVDTILENF